MRILLMDKLSMPERIRRLKNQGYLFIKCGIFEDFLPPEGKLTLLVRPRVVAYAPIANADSMVKTKVGNSHPTGP